MTKTYTAMEVSDNHDIDFQVDDSGNIIKMNIVAKVTYSNGDNVFGKFESLDIWPNLTEQQKITVQTVYDDIKQWFNEQIIG